MDVSFFTFPLSILSFSHILAPSSTFMPVSIFHIDLIVDDILQYLDEVDIHNCRRVNKSLSSMVNQLFWKHLLANSPKPTYAPFAITRRRLDP